MSYCATVHKKALVICVLPTYSLVLCTAYLWQYLSRVAPNPGVPLPLIYLFL